MRDIEGAPTDRHPNPSVWWTNRRRMAWCSLCSGLLVFPALLFVAPEGVRNSLVGIASSYYVLVLTVVGAYVAASTAAEIWRKP